jgi:hypothetical protein
MAVQKPLPAAIGFRVKSGWAAAVLLAGPVAAPQVLDRRAIELCDPSLPDSRQPYHAARGTLQTDAAVIKRLRTAIARAAQRSFTEMMHDYGGFGHRIGAAALVVGSVIDPATVANPHIRAHALEGQLFRTVLEDAARSCALSCSVTLERDLYNRAAEGLRRSEDELKQVVAKLGKSLAGPWRADEKAACLAAWLALARDGRARR